MSSTALILIVAVFALLGGFIFIAWKYYHSKELDDLLQPLSEDQMAQVEAKLKLELIADALKEVVGKR